MKRLILILLLLPFQIVHGADCIPAQGVPIKIGAIFPADNLFSTAASAPYQGVVAMTDAINACGGVNGRPVELVYAPANNREQVPDALEQLRGQVSLIVGSGSPAVSEALTEASGDFVYWEVTEPLNQITDLAVSPRPTSYQLGEQAAAFILSDVVPLLEGEPLRVALIHENRSRALAVAEGIQTQLEPLIVRGFTNTLPYSYEIAVKLREEQINTVIVVAFESDAHSFWYDLRQADANITSWIQIISDDSPYDSCRYNGAVSVGATAMVNETYRVERLGEIYMLYQQDTPDPRADLAASGMYLLLKYVLPNIEGEFTPEAIRAAMFEVDVSQVGLMDEGLNLTEGANSNANALIQQRQDAGFCTLAPAELATCIQTLQSLPTWRERVVAGCR